MEGWEEPSLGSSGEVIPPSHLATHFHALSTTTQYSSGDRNTFLAGVSRWEKDAPHPLRAGCARADGAGARYCSLADSAVPWLCRGTVGTVQRRPGGRALEQLAVDARTSTAPDSMTPQRHERDDELSSGRLRRASRSARARARAGLCGAAPARREGAPWRSERAIAAATWPDGRWAARHELAQDSALGAPRCIRAAAPSAPPRDARIRPPELAHRAAPGRPARGARSRSRPSPLAGDRCSRARRARESTSSGGRRRRTRDQADAAPRRPGSAPASGGTTRRPTAPAPSRDVRRRRAERAPAAAIAPRDRGWRRARPARDPRKQHRQPQVACARRHATRGCARRGGRRALTRAPAAQAPATARAAPPRSGGAQTRAIRRTQCSANACTRARRPSRRQRR